jgi:hypothetical protein
LKNAAGNKYDAFPAGTRLLLGNNSVPTGWSIVASLADRTILTTSTASEIDDTGGSWTISGVTIGNTTLTEAQIPSHTHASVRGGGFVTVGATGIADPGSGSTFNATNSVTASTGGGGSHTHTFSHTGGWRPLYYKAGWIAKS